MIDTATQDRPVRRPALRYFGGKWRLAPWIIRHLPPHFAYVEPFGGGMSVLLRKSRSRAEVVNDLSGDVVNFFRVLRDRPEEIVRAIHLTPYARAERELAFETTDDPLEAARRFYARCWLSRGDDQTSSFRVALNREGRNTTPMQDFMRTDHLVAIAERLRGVAIEHRPALALIDALDHPETLFYCDPPYLHAVRADAGRTIPRHGYEHEMSEEEHVALAGRLQEIRGMALVSGYPSALYDRLYAGWRRVEHDTAGECGVRRRECLWLSPSCDRTQRSLFEEELR